MFFYIADLHIGHNHVLQFDSRPFSNTDEMTEAIIRNWNNKVGKNDTVYVLGDAFWCKDDKAADILQQLHGKKILVQGNHDRIHGKLKTCWDRITGYEEVSDSGKLVILSHYPMMFYKKQHNGAVMLYGHVHNSREWTFVEKWKKEEIEAGVPCNIYNVGCMMSYMDYTPKTLNEIISGAEFYTD